MTQWTMTYLLKILDSLNFETLLKFATFVDNVGMAIF